MVATTLCVGTIGMYHSGIGGGGFMLVRDSKGRYETIDYRETAPAAAHRDMYKDDPNASVFGGLAVGIPGELRGLEYLHNKYGILPWKTVVKPAVRVARDGFPVSEDLVRYMAAATTDNPFLVEDPVWAEDFAPNGTLVKLGDTITRKRFANSLDKIASQGARVFYEGELARSMIDLIQAKDGIMTLDDLRNYQVRVKPALSIQYRDYRLFTTDAPSSGAVMLSILKTMEQYSPQQLAANANLTAHRFVEAMKFAYGARMELGDPDFVDYIPKYQSLMLSDHKAREVQRLIKDNQTQPVDVYDPATVYTADSHGTSHIVTADRSGLTVSSTTTINLLFGAQIMTPDTGIILNNEMDDFSQPDRNNSFGYAPSPSNFIAPGKRPLSSITPLMAEHAANGTLAFATGAAGGSRIISSTTQVAWHLLEARRATMRAAIAAARLHHQLMPDNLQVERGFDRGGGAKPQGCYAEGFDNATFAAFLDRGHNATWRESMGSSVQGILRLWNGTFAAAGETRQMNSGGLVV